MALRSILKQNFDEGLLCKRFNLLLFKIAVAKHVDLFFDLGVPNWRLYKFPQLYQQLLSQKNVLIAADGLSEAELEKLTPTVAALCNEL